MSDEPLLARYFSRCSSGTSDQSCEYVSAMSRYVPSNISALSHLVEVDDWLPELVLQLVEVPHTDFTEVTRVVFVHVGAVVVLTTGKTTTTGMLPVLADTTVTGRDVAATVDEELVGSFFSLRSAPVSLQGSLDSGGAEHSCRRGRTACGSWRDE